MAVLLLLTDDDDETMLVSCADEEEAQSVGSAAVMSDGGVSAWLVPAVAYVDTAMIRERLLEGESLSRIHEALVDASVIPR